MLQAKRPAEDLTMTRYAIEARDPTRHLVTVGWDAPLHTFFVQIEDARLVAENRLIDDFLASQPTQSMTYARMANGWHDDTMLLHRGTTIGEIPNLLKLRRILMPYASIPRDVADALLDDKARTPPPTLLERTVGRLIGAARRGLAPTLETKETFHVGKSRRRACR